MTLVTPQLPLSTRVLACGNGRISRNNNGPRRARQRSRGMADLREQIDMTYVTPACAKPTPGYPQGRTGTIAGYGAHRHAGEPVCESCATARRRIRAEERARSLACFPGGNQGTLDGYKAHLGAGQRPCSDCRRALVPEPGLACALPTLDFPGGRTGTAAGYQAHYVQGEEACAPCADAHAGKCQTRHRNLSEDEREAVRAGNRVATKKWRERNPGEARDAAHRIIGRNRAAVREAKNQPCTDCGVRYPYYVMEFDHLDSETKEFNVSAGITRASYERLMAEIAKCEVVCANCHAERTHQRKQTRKGAQADAV